MNRSSSPQSALDASAVLSYLLQEPGSAEVSAALRGGSAISTANLAEVYTRLVTRGRPLDATLSHLLALGLLVYPVTEEDARAAARLFPSTRPFGLSLGDRLCLSLGQRLSVPVLTADRVWSQLQVGVTIQLIR